MGKTYIDTVKYVIYASMEIGGLIEKPDVVGALFGQTEGLLGDELDLRELQKNGRIGRIEVDLQTRGGKTVGKVTLPSSLDMVETSILAAALETVDRVGPCEARVAVEKIEDTRNMKRQQVVERAKNLLKHFLATQLPEAKELSEMVRQEVKLAEISEWGSERLPAGPGLDSFDSIIVAEGRADVINLLKNDVNNVVAIGGANVPSSLADLCRRKEVTVFLDGDRGGDIILRELSQACEIDFVARAPRGKEVEELTRKEIIKCLRSRIPADQIEGLPKPSKRDDDGPLPERRGRPMPSDAPRQPAQADYSPPPLQSPSAAPAPTMTVQAPPVPDTLRSSLNELENTLRARLYTEDGSLKSEIPVRDLIKTLEETGGAYSVVLDGIITQRLVDLAEQKGVKILLGVKLGSLFKRPAGMAISTKS